jgi:subtilisin family serine protease
MGEMGHGPTSRSRSFRAAGAVESTVPLPGVFAAHQTASPETLGPLTPADLAERRIAPDVAERWRRAGWWLVKSPAPSAPDVGPREVYLDPGGFVRIGARRVSVLLSDRANAAAARSRLAAAGAQVVHASGTGLLVLRVPPGESPYAFAQRLARDPAVAAVEVETLRLFEGRALDDPRIGDQWQWENPKGGDSRARKAWDAATGDGRRVAVVDFTFRTTHEDLAPAIDAEGSAEFVEEPYTGRLVLRPLGSEGADDHGTKVAGLAAAAGGNGVGGCGAAPRARLHLIAIHRGATREAFARAVDFARDPSSEGRSAPGADVLTSSVGWRGASGAHVDASIRRLSEGRGGLGVLFFWALTNDDALVSSPRDDAIAAQHGVIGVGATRPDDDRLVGGRGPLLDLVAPGQEVLTTGSARDDDYRADQGCSMAAPIVAGIAALVLERHPTFTRAQLWEVLRSSADRVGPPADYGPDGRAERFGHGRVNAARALEVATQPPTRARDVDLDS